MAIGYQLLKDGQIVYVSRTSATTPSGRTTHLTKGEVGVAGKIYLDMSSHIKEQIEAGELTDIWKVVELPDADSESIEATGTQPLTPDEQAAFMTADLKAMEPEDLQNVADRIGLDVQGTGTAGRVLKRDLVTALEHERDEQAG